MTKKYTLFFFLLLVGITAGAQVRVSEGVEVDRTVHDFGDILLSDGPVSCSFKVRNTGKEDLNILSVVSSCGCTDVKWTRETIPPGGSGTISATFKNQDPPNPFDKSLTVYLTGVQKPLVLHLRGVVTQDRRSLSTTYPVHFGSLGMRSALVNAGEITRGKGRTGRVKIANISGKSLQLSFRDLSPGLELSVEPNPIPAHGTATLCYSIQPLGDQIGACNYYATPLVRGKSYPQEITGPNPELIPADGAEHMRTDSDPRCAQGGLEICFQTYVKQDFSQLSPKERDAGPNPIFGQGANYDFPPSPAGTIVHAVFSFKNTGKSPLHIYKADCDLSAVHDISFDQDVKPGATGYIRATLDTSGQAKGEFLSMIRLATNSPLRPYVTLFIAGFIQ